MKRILAILLAAVLVLSLGSAALAAQVQPTSQKITINGEAVDCPAYNIDGYNYVKLRTLAALFAKTDSPFDVEYDEEANAVIVTSGRAYSGEAEENGGEDLSASAVESAQKVIIDGAERTDLSVWNIGGNNWFKLAELSKALGFGLSYNEATRTAAIVTGKPIANASDYAEVYAAIKAAGGGRNSGVRGGGVAVETEAVEAPATADSSSQKSADENGATGAGGDYSGTNVQVEGFDEGDIAKTDGEYIYIIRYDELIILRADGKDTEEVSRTKVGMESYEESESAKDYWYKSEYKYPREMFVSGGRLTVISQYYRYSYSYAEKGRAGENVNYACVDIYDVSDPSAPKLVESLGQDGSVLGTRMTGGKVYVITSYWVWNWDEEDVSTYVPSLYKDGEMHILPVEKIYICPGCSSTEYVVACAYDTAGAECTASNSVLGCGDRLYMSEGGIYVLGSSWYDRVEKSYTESVYTVEEHLSGSETEIIRMDAESLKVTASGKVPGYIDSQFSADEYEGFLRIVTTVSDSSYRIYRDDEYGFENWKWDGDKMSNGLYVLDGALKVVGKVDDLAPGERVYSARFDGEIAYFTTFRNVDPLFAADLSDPANPRILSALKISGFSEYLHNWNENRLFGLGREANEENGWAEGLKLVMFDTSDKTNVTAKHVLVLDDASYSEALYDHKAVFIDPARGYIGFATQEEYRVYTYDDANGFRLAARFDFGTWPMFARGFRIGEQAYVVTGNEVCVLQLPDWSRVTFYEIAEK